VIQERFTLPSAIITVILKMITFTGCIYILQEKKIKKEK